MHIGKANQGAGGELVNMISNSAKTVFSACTETFDHAIMNFR